MFGCEMSLYLHYGEHLVCQRKPGPSSIPSFRPNKRLHLDATLFAAAHDPVRDRYILTFSQEDRVIGVNAKTLKTELELQSPWSGLRGLGLRPDLRRGFFNSVYGNVMISFDLDSFEVRKVIEGFSIRPERIYLDGNTATLVTGNLGLTWGDEFYELAPKVSPGVSDLRGRTITLLDTDSEEVTGTLAAGLRPTAVGISAKHIIAGNFGDNTVSIYDRSAPGEATVAALPPATSIDVEFELHDTPTGDTIKHKKNLYSRMVEGSAILDGRGWVLVTCFDVCVLAVIDIGTGVLTDYIPVLNQPFDVVADGAEKYAYVSCHVSNAVSVVDLDLKREVGRIQVGPAPVDLTLADDTLLVPDSLGLTVVDLGEAKKAMGL